MEQMSDEHIAHIVQNGNADAFGVLIDRYEAKLMRYGKRFLYSHDDVTDIVHDVFLQAYTNIQSFDINKRFSPWIYRIAHNRYVNEIRKRSRNPIVFMSPEILFPYAVAEEETDAETRKREMSAELEGALAQIKEIYREPLILYFFEEMSYQDISDVLHIPTTTVGVRIKRGKEMVKRVYQERNA